jgi:hypothetical protein
MNNLHEQNKELMHEAFVPPEVYERLVRPKSPDSPVIPLVWMVSYRAEGALQNIRYFENGVRHCKLEFPIRVFFSHWTDAILVSYVPLEAVREPHVQEWYVTFYEVPVEEAKRRLAEFPRFPYDGRNADLVRAEMLTDGSVQTLLKRSYAKLRELKVPLEEKFPGALKGY